MLALARRTFDVDHARQYGVPGQKQDGIDLYLRLAAAKDPDRRYVTIQCRNVAAITPSTIVDAVDTLAEGRWGGRTATFVYATRASTRRTEISEAIEVAARRLEDSHVRFEVWDGDRLSECLRDQPDLVELFFGMATMEVFCVTAPQAILSANVGSTPTTGAGGRTGRTSRTGRTKQPASAPPGSVELARRRAVPVPGLWRMTKGGPLTIGLSNGVKEILPPTYRVAPAAEMVGSPTVRVGLAIASQPLPADAPSTSEIRRRFVGLLSRPPLTQIVGAVAADSASSTWRSYGDVGRSHYAAILAPQSAPDTPVAWARLLLPTTDQFVVGRDPRCTNFVIHADWSTPHGAEARAPADLRRWRAVMMLALSLPTAIATYLTDELRMTVGVDPMPTIGIWLATNSNLAELIDLDGLTRVEGSYMSNGWDAYAVADSAGQSPAAVTADWISHLCDDALHLDGYEGAV